MKKLYLIKLGEISLKGQNRALFENRLRHNIKDKLRPYHSNVVKQKGRIFFYIDPECPDEVIDKALSTTFGIIAYAEAVVCEKNMDLIREKAEYLIKKAGLTGKESFKVQSRREDKGFELSSYQISCDLADLIHNIYPDMRVDLTNPDFVLNVEIRSEAYLYTSQKKGIGGLPSGTAGKGILLLSGGIDSPVAGFEMAKRGVNLDCLYFHAYPYTSDEALEKVKTLAKLISPYLGGTRLFVVPFTQQQLYIRDNAYEDETTLMFRACMMQVAERLCNERGYNAIITGEALSQVASQTLPAMAFTDSMTDYLVLRPLVGMDKEEIISISKKIGTYETSILPFEDCCVIFSPKHPVTNPDKKLMTKHFEKLDMGQMLDKAVRETKIYSYNAKGEEIETN
ncbi:tRNA uracil 4-sulfurtransferase ThiI [Bullifex sp.]|uniref:tRNA uracil 4-sulfurtransferase ThiI n=1 Tax=Bullifex sp. TaxID=2815808 RepID=UPI002A7F0ED7|nr:tRNA uracil 4-sulfurtransferase ThiI [Bullifex sp.]MDY4067169.1 tRNA uracil 4-sulfurtransferase ThiI [Bullifex sp.]